MTEDKSYKTELSDSTTPTSLSTLNSNQNPMAYAVKQTVVSGHTFSISNRYDFTNCRILGRGSYGVVSQAIDTLTKQRLAIKRIRPYANDEWDGRHTLREIRLMKLLSNHPNIITLYELSLYQEKMELYMVMELMDCDLHHIIQSKQALTEMHYKCFARQILEGLKAMHAIGVFHRDLKPGNLLVSKDCQLRITDFGLARYMDDETLKGNNDSNPQTEYVVTRWYRCPELLLSPNRPYSTAIDIWSVGCIMAELIRRKPLFPGKSHANQVQLIFEVLGYSNPSELGFPISAEATSFLNKRCKSAGQDLWDVVPEASEEAVCFIAAMLDVNPKHRPTAAQALDLPYMMDADIVCDYSHAHCAPPAPGMFKFERQKLSTDALKELIHMEVFCSPAEPDLGYPDCDRDTASAATDHHIEYHTVSHTDNGALSSDVEGLKKNEIIAHTNCSKPAAANDDDIAAAAAIQASMTSSSATTVESSASSATAAQPVSDIIASTATASIDEQKISPRSTSTPISQEQASTAVAAKSTAASMVQSQELLPSQTQTRPSKTDATVTFADDTFSSKYSGPLAGSQSSKEAPTVAKGLPQHAAGGRAPFIPSHSEKGIVHVPEPEVTEIHAPEHHKDCGSEGLPPQQQQAASLKEGGQGQGWFPKKQSSHPPPAASASVTNASRPQSSSNNSQQSFSERRKNKNADGNPTSAAASTTTISDNSSSEKHSNNYSNNSSNSLTFIQSLRSKLASSARNSFNASAAAADSKESASSVAGGGGGSETDTPPSSQRISSSTTLPLLRPLSSMFSSALNLTKQSSSGGGSSSARRGEAYAHTHDKDANITTNSFRAQTSTSHSLKASASGSTNNPATVTGPAAADLIGVSPSRLLAGTDSSDSFLPYVKEYQLEHLHPDQSSSAIDTDPHGPHAASAAGVTSSDKKHATTELPRLPLAAEQDMVMSDITQRSLISQRSMSKDLSPAPSHTGQSQTITMPDIRKSGDIAAAVMASATADARRCSEPLLVPRSSSKSPCDGGAVKAPDADAALIHATIVFQSVSAQASPSANFKIVHSEQESEHLPNINR